MELDSHEQFPLSGDQSKMPGESLRETQFADVIYRRH